MHFFMARTFDHGGYYETRAILALFTGVYAVYRAARGDRRFLVMFLSGILFQGLMEGMIAASNLRGAHFSISVFGQVFSGFPAFFLHGLLEGGPLSLMSFWFADLVMRPHGRRETNAYVFALAGIVVLALIT